MNSFIYALVMCTAWAVPQCQFIDGPFRSPQECQRLIDLRNSTPETKLPPGHKDRIWFRCYRKSVNDWEPVRYNDDPCAKFPSTSYALMDCRKREGLDRSRDEDGEPANEMELDQK